MNSNNWCNPAKPVYTVGLLVYILLTIFFAYFYTSITFNPLEIANNMKKSGGFVPVFVRENRQLNICRKF